jgi:hypothetical protein
LNTKPNIVPGLVERAQLPHGCGEIVAAIAKFEGWLETQGGRSYDPYDLWGTSYGVFARTLYYRAGAIALPFILPILALDGIFPSARSLFVARERFPAADAQLGLSFLNLYEITGEAAYLEKAETLGRTLVELSVPGYHGHCWGYPFDWRNRFGFWRKNTPLITTTAYGYELFARLHDVTGDKLHLDIAKSVAGFVHKDLRDTLTSATAAAGSYTPADRSRVLNVSAYRAMVLVDAAHRFGESAYAQAARRNLNFVLENQRPDGAWLYSLDDGEQFIDHFHTCFVLKSLWKIKQYVHDSDLADALQRGFGYYRSELFDSDGMPKPFAVKPRLQIVKRNMYDVAEAISLGVLLRNEMPGAYGIAERLVFRLCREWQLPPGFFVTQVYVGGLCHRLPFLRWAQAPLFYALTNFLQSLAPRDDIRCFE